jgi:hygromycin-B 7''-O-kinase
MTPIRAAASAIAIDHGVDPDEVTEIPGGVANHVFRLGPALILRIPRSSDFIADLHKEVAVIPVARSAGVRTPALVAQGTIPLDGTPTPYVLMDRVQGNDLVTHPGPTIWADLGREVALLHQVHQQSLTGVPEDSGTGRGSAEELVDRGYLDPETGRWLGSWMGRLRGRFDENSPKVLLHGDLAPQNLMVDDAGRFAALIDWGDAAWGPRGMEFAKLRLEDVARLLPAYKDVADVRFEPGELEASVLWFHLQWGLSNLTGPPRLGARHWTAPPASRVLGVLRFLASNPPEPWDGAIKKMDHWV